MAGSVRENLHCLVCNSRVGVSTRTSLQIFHKESQTCTEKPLSQVMSQVLEDQISEDSVHSMLICKKCFKLFDELEELETRIDAIKDEVLGNYHKTINQVKNGELDDDLEKENMLSKKLLDIPMLSDEDTQGEKVSTFRTMEDIELQLVKLHTEKQAGTVNILSNIIDTGTMEHSSDSDYDPSNDNTDELLQAAATAEKDFFLFQGSKIKLEPSTEINEKPNILKRKDVASIIAKVDIVTPVVTREYDMYTCLLCDESETVSGEAKAIIAHLKQAHDTRLYICDVCGQEFRKRNDLSLHLDDHVASEEGDFQCEVCNRIFTNLRLFRIHKRMHYPQTKAWSCNLCGKKYSSKNLLDEHMNVHTGVRPYICATCGKDFASKYTFKAHEKTHEVRPRPFSCSHCNKSFLSQQNLSQHERTHTGKQFGSAHNLEVHSIVHTGYKPFICGLCGKAFARKAEIRDHERTHTGERPYQCEFCGATFSQRSNLQSHKRATHYDDKRYKCENCGKGFKRRRLLDYHIKAVHTGERPFKCMVCDATFVYPEHFKKHRRIHTGEKPFLCEVCGKAFNSRDNRNAHRFVHSDKKPYECLVCGAGFMRKPLLYQHMQSEGHLNDTIIVNQPRLTTDDHQIITVNADGEMEIVEANGVTSLETMEGGDEDTTEDSKLYIAEQMLVEGGQIFADSKDFILNDHSVDGDDIGHIVIGEQFGHGQIVQQEEEEDESETEGENVLTTVNDLDEIITDNLAVGKSEMIEEPHSPVRYVHVRIPKKGGGEGVTLVRILRK